MREIKFEPKTIGFTGSMVVKVPSVIEKLRLMKEMGLSVNSEGQVDLKKLEEIGHLGMAEIMMSKVMPFISSVDLVYQADGIEPAPVKEVSDLEMYNECMPILAEVFHFLCQGLSLGKN